MVSALVEIAGGGARSERHVIAARGARVGSTLACDIRLPALAGAPELELSVEPEPLGCRIVVTRGSGLVRHEGQPFTAGLVVWDGELFASALRLRFVRPD